MDVAIEGRGLPGKRFCDSAGEPLDSVHVGLQIRRDPHGLLPGNAASARWEVEVSVVEGPDGDVDFRGPVVQGRRGERFLYLTWANVNPRGEFEMFRRAKLMLDRIDPDLVRSAEAEDCLLVATVNLSAADGSPRCARVDPPDLEWTLA